MNDQDAAGDPPLAPAPAVPPVVNDPATFSAQLETIFRIDPDAARCRSGSSPWRIRASAGACTSLVPLEVEHERRIVVRCAVGPQHRCPHSRAAVILRILFRAARRRLWQLQSRRRPTEDRKSSPRTDGRTGHVPRS